MMGFPPFRGAPPPAGTPRLTVTLPAAAAEIAAAFLREHCADGLQLRDAETGLPAAALARAAKDESGHESADRPSADPPVQLVAWPAPEIAAELVFGLRELFAGLRAEGLLRGRTHVELDDDPGLWARPAQAVRIAGRFVIAAPWVPYEPGEGELLLPVDPAGAFGDGRHPSTALALMEILRFAQEGALPDRVLDVGCGSGILALAAALTWPDAQVVAVDVDPVAVAAATANVARAGLADRVAVQHGSADAVDGTFPLVLANLTGGHLERLAAPLAERLRPGGHVVTAGYPLGARDRIERIFVAHGLYGVHADSLDEWAALTFVR